ncbi:MAG: phosphoribosylglycinamide formyltransferase [Bacteroidota bacterium]
MKNIAVFASGNGSNAENIIRYFSQNKQFGIHVSFVITNRKQAGVINKAKALGVSSFVFSNAEIENPERLIFFFKENNIDLLVLAGFLRPIPVELLKLYPNKVINIHPSLLPNYGGKGMYGFKIHEAVLANNEKETGITIHYVIEEYDKGEIIFQTKCSISENETVETLATKIYQLEQKHFPETIVKVMAKL